MKEKKMNIVNYQTYENDLNSFISKHSKKSDLHIWTSPLTDGEYHKEYLFEDGSGFYEINNTNYKEDVEVEVHGITIKVEIKIVKHEYWSTDTSSSKIWYEKY